MGREGGREGGKEERREEGREEERREGYKKKTPVSQAHSVPDRYGTRLFI